MTYGEIIKLVSDRDTKIAQVRMLWRNGAQESELIINSKGIVLDRLPLPREQGLWVLAQLQKTHNLVACTFGFNVRDGL